MKIFVVFPVSIVLVSILFCPTVWAAPPIPDYVQIVNPDPSLPEELSAFFGKYQGVSGSIKYFLIVAQIDKEKAILHIWRDGDLLPQFKGWETIKAQVFKEGGEYQLWYQPRWGGSSEAVLKGKYLQLTSRFGVVRLSRVAISAHFMPSDLKMVQPDPSLPKEVSAFFGKWEGADVYGQYLYIVEKIDSEKASLYFYRSFSGTSGGAGWFKYEGIVTKEGKKYKVSYQGGTGPTNLTLKEEYLDASSPRWSARFTRLQQ
jgi:hypothetical protein